MLCVREVLNAVGAPIEFDELLARFGLKKEGTKKNRRNFFIEFISVN